MFQWRLKGNHGLGPSPSPRHPGSPGSYCNAPEGLELVCVVRDRKLRLLVRADELWDFLDYSDYEFGD